MNALFYIAKIWFCVVWTYQQIILYPYISANFDESNGFVLIFFLFFLVFGWFVIFLPKEFLKK